MSTQTAQQTTTQTTYPASWPYEDKAGCTIYNAKIEYKDGSFRHTQTEVCNFVAKITVEIIGEDGSRSFGITGFDHQGTGFYVEISDEDFSNENRLKAIILRHAGSWAIVAARAGVHLGPAIQHFTTKPILRLRYHRTGWTNGKFLIPGRQDKYTISIELPRKLPYSVNPQADLDKGLEALSALLQVTDISPIVTTFAFTAPLAKAAGWRESDRFALFLSGMTGTFKTSFAQCLMCLYGPDFIKDDILIRFGDGATKLSMQKLASHAHDLPLLIDNFKPNVSPGAPGFVAMLHSMVEGGEKDRLDRSGELRESSPIFTWPIFTGEDVPDNDTASLARLLKIDWTNGNSDKLTEAQNLSSHLCAVGNAWLDFVESASGKAIIQTAATEFEQRRAYWAKKLEESDKDSQNRFRVASNLAINELTWKIMRHADSPISKILNGFDHKTSLEMIAATMAGSTAAATESVRFLDALGQITSVIEEELYTQVSFNSKVNPTTSKFAPTDPQYDKINYSNLIGWKDGDKVYLIVDKARKAVDDLLGKDGLNGISNDRLYQQLKDQIADKGSDGKSTILKRHKGSGPIRVLCLKNDAIWKPESVTP